MLRCNHPKSVVDSSKLFVRRRRFPFWRVALGLAACALLVVGQSGVAVTQVRLHQFEDGPEVSVGYEFLPGETGWFSARASKFKTETNPETEERSVKLAWEARVTDPKGVLLEPPKTGRIEETLRPQDKNWQPKITGSFLVPPYAIGGMYSVQVKVQDVLSRSQAVGVLQFTVKAPEFQEPEKLSILDFHFLEGENSPEIRLSPVYHPGETLWAGFDIAGFKRTEGNRFSVSYGLAVSGADGRELFSQPRAAEESKESFYPQRWVPGRLSLKLDSNVAPGSYTLLIKAEDDIGGQSAESSANFEVK
jgi:hypothetical protein